jgi:hypothetical protein
LAYQLILEDGCKGTSEKKLSKDQLKELSDHIQVLDHEAKQRGILEKQIIVLLDSILNGRLGKKRSLMYHFMNSKINTGSR